MRMEAARRETVDPSARRSSTAVRSTRKGSRRSEAASVKERVTGPLSEATSPHPPQPARRRPAASRKRRAGPAPLPGSGKRIERQAGMELTSKLPPRVDIGAPAGWTVSSGKKGADRKVHILARIFAPAGGKRPTGVWELGLSW